MTGYVALSHQHILSFRRRRLGIAGWSHGGFMSAWAIGQTDRFRAALVGAGVIDWGMLAATGEYGQFEVALGGSIGWCGIDP